MRTNSSDTRWRHLWTWLVIAGFALLGAGTAPEETEEERAEREAAQAEERAGMDAYIARMAAIRAAIDQQMAAGPSPVACDRPTMAGLAQVNEQGNLEMRSAYGPFLDRFGSDDREVWADDGGYWEWMTDSVYQGHFREHPDDREPYAIRDTAGRLQETFLPERYLVVIEPDPNGVQRIPVLEDDDLLDGHFDGWVFIVDQVDGGITCQQPLTFGQSDTVLLALIQEDADEEIHEDLEEGCAEAMQRVLPRGTRLITSMGGLL